MIISNIRSVGNDGDIGASEVEITLRLNQDDLHRINGRWGLLSYCPRKLTPTVIAAPQRNLKQAVELIGKPFTIMISGDTVSVVE